MRQMDGGSGMPCHAGKPPRVGRKRVRWDDNEDENVSAQAAAGVGVWHWT
jgi:hypothetical protein